MPAGARRWREPLATAFGLGAATVTVAALAAVPAVAQGSGARLETGAASAPRLVIDPPPTRSPGWATTGASTSLEPAYSLTRTFGLHSLPGSAHTIFLDFDGGDVSGTAWNAPDVGLAARSYPGWVLDGSRTFDRQALANIQSVWQRVAEDFAPFDVDVTTADPGAAALDRSGPDDPAYGTRVLISSSRSAQAAVCPDGCTGAAWVDVFDLSAAHDYYQPAWVFPRMLGNDVKDVADVVSHEVGHTFGLTHDGTTTDEYYGGHATWAPIMGAGFGRPITQWSRGGYAGANNQQDDLAVIAADGAPVRADEAPGDPTGAGPLPLGPAYVTSDADVDVYALGTCAGPVVLRARPAPVSPDLDIRLRLLRPDGTVVASANPPSGRVSYDRARGLSATIAATVPPGPYLVSVAGVGHRGAVRGYDGYASVGAYTVRQTGCL